VPSLPIKATQNWSCEWDQRDDAMLLVGVWRHGLGNWEAMQKDSSLGFATKFFLEDPKKAGSDKAKKSPTPVHLVRRADHLLHLLLEAEGARLSSNKGKKREPSEEPVRKPKAKAKAKVSTPALIGDSPRESGTPVASTSRDGGAVGAKEKKRKRLSPPAARHSSGEEEEVARYASMDEDACKQMLRPARHSMKAIKASGEMDRQAKAALLKKEMTVIALRIEAILRDKGGDTEKLRKHLWHFVTFFMPNGSAWSRLLADLRS
jgi:chromodomain-helicase-DNA-binding protein 1